MYICPVCNKKFEKEEILVKHLSTCWKEKNLSHKSKDAPRSGDRVTRTVNKDIESFFNSFKSFK